MQDANILFTMQPKIDAMQRLSLHPHPCTCAVIPWVRTPLQTVPETRYYDVFEHETERLQ